jgi:RND family efflux transporter MFP subunit
MLQKNTLLALGLTALVAGGVYACNRDGNAEATPAEAAPVVVGPENIVTALADTIRTGPSVSGTLDAERSATLRAEVGAQVTEVLVEPGTPVAAGQVLVRLDQTGIRDQYQSAQSSLRAAETAATLAREDLERDQRLYQAGALAQRQLEATRRASLQAEAGLADARARYATAELGMRRTELRAPFRGVISARPVKVGDIVQVGAAIATVVDPASLRLEAQVPVGQLAAVKVGTPVIFTITGGDGGEVTGRVTRVNPAVDPVTRQVPIVVSLPNREGHLVAGLFADGRVATESRAGVTVPKAAVDQRGLRPVVYRLRGGVLEKVEVELGFDDPVTERVEIRRGIAGGDTLLVGAAQGLAAGTAVRITAPVEQPAAAPAGR